MKSFFTTLALLSFFSILSNSILAQTVSTQKTIYAPDENIIINYYGFPGNLKDWITIVPITHKDNEISQWFFTNGLHSGVMTFNGLPFGDYEVRGYFNNDYVVRTRYRFRIGNVDQNIQVITQKNIYTPDEKIMVNFSGFPGNKKDWVTVVPITNKDNEASQWIFTEGQQSGTMAFNGLPYGTYEVRGYFNNDYTVRSRYSFKVGNIDQNTIVRTQRNPYPENDKIVIEYSGFPGNKKDWITVVPITNKDNEISQWIFTDGIQNGTMNFNGLPAGNYEVRGFYNNEYVIRARYPFVVGSRGGISSISQRLCRKELSVFYAGMGGLGSAWGRAANEPSTMNASAIIDIQNVMRNAVDALTVVKCIPFDVEKLNRLIARIPSLSNTQAATEIEALIKELQIAVAQVQSGCDNGATLSSLYVTAVHVGAAQAWASSRMCMPAPMPANIQTVIQNHLLTAQNAFSSFLPCVPGFSLSQFSSVPVGSMNSTEPHTHIVGLHTMLLWNISLSECCCNCKAN